jgi:carbon-monoxide dehydrogenase small subunit
MIETDEKHHTVTINVNGLRHTASVEARKLLVHMLRDDLGFTGTHVGCNTSQCGACTVDIDGLAVKSCTVLAVMADGSTSVPKSRAIVIFCRCAVPFSTTATCRPF